MTHYTLITELFDVDDSEHGDPWGCIADIADALDDTQYRVVEDLRDGSGYALAVERDDDD